MIKAIKRFLGLGKPPREFTIPEEQEEKLKKLFVEALEEEKRHDAAMQANFEAVAKVVDEVDEKIPEAKVGGWTLFLKGDHLVITERT